MKKAVLGLLLLGLLLFLFVSVCFASPKPKGVGNLPMLRAVAEFPITAKAGLQVKTRAGTTGHSIVLTWAAPSDAVSTSTYNVYRLSATCPATPTGFTSLTTGVTTLTYTDATVTVGSWCYYVTQVQNSIESNPSNMAGTSVKPLAPVLTATGQ